MLQILMGGTRLIKIFGGYKVFRECSPGSSFIVFKERTSLFKVIEREEPRLRPDYHWLVQANAGPQILRIPNPLAAAQPILGMRAQGAVVKFVLFWRLQLRRWSWYVKPLGSGLVNLRFEALGDFRLA